MSKLTAAQAATLGIALPKYEDLTDRIVAAQGEFVGISPDDLGGDHITAKQTTLLRAARKRGLRITTTCRRKGMIFARLLLNSASSHELPTQSEVPNAQQL